MKIKLLVLTFGMLTFLSCSDGETKKQLSELKIELEKTKSELNTCSAELTEIKNTAENRFIRAKKLLSDKNLNGAKSEFQGIVENFKGTIDAKTASREITKIDNTIKRRKLEEERKKALGFKILKPTSSVKFGGLTLKFTKIWTGKRWSFDDYGSEYRLRDAQRGNKHVLARVSISSTNNNPSLPPVLVYQMNDGELTRLGTLEYEFRRWKDYGTYLGNNADYGNDFAHSKTIPFNLGLQLSNKKLVGKSIYIVMKKTGCFNRTKKNYGNPEIEYQKGSCNPKYTLKVEDFDSEYVLLKKI
ncbi:hypothetical protein [Tenacibaculum haliotis]|uniref:hypothetical protein n=1 Tax=Tenacibaculum haliotis TaxID=1888914 RepID=UPI0021AFB6DB|nr:hypothetical protein [Tenacibaculum haliotis]MCT4697544.1 hypothetical protein [Tenacibaculum haliotis]